MQDPRSATDLLSESRFVQRLNAMGAMVLAAWADSSARRLAAKAWRPIRGRSPAEQLRMGALVVMWAGLFHIVGLLVLPRYVISGLPVVWFAGGVGAAALVAVVAEAIVTAWRDSVVFGAARWLMGIHLNQGDNNNP